MKKPPIPFAKIGDVIYAHFEGEGAQYKIISYTFSKGRSNYGTDMKLKDSNFLFIRDELILYNLTTQKENPNFKS